LQQRATSKSEFNGNTTLFVQAVEPTLQRELKHKRAANGDDSYSADLIGYVEITGGGTQSK
jgi:hypothetical protein